MKLEGIYYFKPLEFYKYIINTDVEQIKLDLEESMFFSLLSQHTWEEKEYFYKDASGGRYSLNNNYLMGYVKDLAKFYEDLDVSEIPEIKEKVIVTTKDSYGRNSIDIELRDNKYKVSESFVTKFLEPEKVYKDVSYTKMRIGINSTTENAISISENETLNGIEESLELTRQEVALAEEKLKKEIEDLEKKQEEEMQNLKQKYALTMSKAKFEIAEKIMPLMKDIEDMTDKFTVLESNLYRWLSYNGYNYSIKQLTKGRKGDSSEKFVIWQKLRYLDEELPKLVLDPEVEHNVKFGEFKSLENLMAKYPVIRDFFLPSEKGCIVFQLSKSPVKSYISKVIKTEESDPHHPWIEFIKKSYLVENWNKLGMFLKNGDNLYVLWLDKERINVSSDNLFLTKNSQEVTELNYYDLEDTEDIPEYKKGDTALSNIDTMKRNYQKRRDAYAKFSARIYIVDIIQGIADNLPEVLSLGENQNVIKALSLGTFGNIVFNNADGYLNYSKWNSVKEIIQEIINSYGKRSYSTGDPIYLLHAITGKDRGRVNGSYQMENLTNDASCDAGVTKINLIDYEDQYYWTKELTKDMLKFDDKSKKYVLKEDYRYCEILTQHESVWKDETKYTFHNYVSEPKTIEGWLTDNLGKAPIVYYKVVIYKETKRIDHPHKSNKRSVILSSYNNSDLIPYADHMYRAIDSFYHPTRYHNPETSLANLNNRYPGLYKGEDGRYHYEFEQSEIFRETQNNRDLENYISLGFTYNESWFKRIEHLYVAGNKSWAQSNANMLINDYEFFPLKYATLEQANYMITNSMSLPGYNNYSDSVKHLLRIRNWIIERDKNKKEKHNG